MTGRLIRLKDVKRSREDNREDALHERIADAVTAFINADKDAPPTMMVLSIATFTPTPADDGRPLHWSVHSLLMPKDEQERLGRGHSVTTGTLDSALYAIAVQQTRDFWKEEWRKKEKT
jgi:hypothetical protein